MKEVGKMTKDIPIDQWKEYLVFNLLNSYASYLSKDIEKTQFDFYGTVLSGKTKMKERWKKVVEATSSSLGEAVGKIYVGKYFPPEAKNPHGRIG